jgi:hypothetical protein
VIREEFQGHVALVFSSAAEWRGEDHLYWGYGTEDHYEVSWVSGGMCGGNCWGDNADSEVSAEAEPELTKLDELLELVAPRMTIKQYKKLLADVVQRDDRSDYEYYGNYTTYGVKRVQFDTLYQALQDMKVF